MADVGRWRTAGKCDEFDDPRSGAPSDRGEMPLLVSDGRYPAHVPRRTAFRMQHGARLVQCPDTDQLSGDASGRHPDPNTLLELFAGAAGRRCCDRFRQGAADDGRLAARYFQNTANLGKLDGAERHDLSLCHSGCNLSGRNATRHPAGGYSTGICDRRRRGLARQLFGERTDCLSRRCRGDARRRAETIAGIARPWAAR